MLKVTREGNLRECYNFDFNRGKMNLFRQDRKKDMSFLDLANKRYSVRNYNNTPVPQEKFKRCIEAARLAPSACNSQPWKFIVVDDLKFINELAKAAFEGILDFNHFAFEAPVLILIVPER